MKKQYMKPTMRVVKIQQQQIICTSPGGYDNHSLGMQGGTIDDEDDVW